MVAVFVGSLEKTINYLRRNYSYAKWNCPAGCEDVEGIIDVLTSGYYSDSERGEDCGFFEIDYFGNISCVGDGFVFASIQEDG